MGRDIRFSREPYTVTYFKEGEKQTIRRVPPPKLHRALPDDRVELTRTKNADFQAGDSFKVQSISPRQPNVLQLVNEDGLSTFIDHYDTLLVDQGGTTLNERGEIVARPIDNDYLLWP